jgi:hypothetical protein
LKSHELIYRSIVMTTRRPSSLRCSRPLCSSQSTNSTPPPRSPSRRPVRPAEVPSRPPPEEDDRCPVPQDPTTCTRPAHQPPLSPHRSDVLTRTSRAGASSYVPPMSSPQRHPL